jgi:DNA-cytosine methyltransferase
MLTMGSLFAGIGGFDLGFERAGFKTVWQVEIEPDCLAVLADQFPHAERFTDVRECGPEHLARVDVICAGFPCQDVSIGNTGEWAGLDGERSGLVFDVVRIVRSLRPRVVVLENVSALLGRGLGRIFGALAEIGYDGEWDCIPASRVGANHRRDRIWIVAYPREARLARRVFGASLLKPEEMPFPQLGDDLPGGWSPLPTAIQRIPHSDGLSVGMVRRLVSPFGNAVVPQIPELIARRLKEIL